MNTCRHCDPHKALLGVLVLGVALTAGCGDIPGDAEDTGSIMKVELITGWEDQEDKNTVDVVRGTCEAGEGEGKTEPEPFYDHLARVEITNRPLPNTDEQTASPVYLKSYTITYQAIDNTINGPLPELVGYVEIPIQDSRGIPPCNPGQSSCPATEYFLKKFFHIEKKQEYFEKLCGAPYGPPWPTGEFEAPFPDRCEWTPLDTNGDGKPDYYVLSDLAQGEYNVQYTFYGENIFGEKFSFEAGTVALLDNYDNCK